MKKWDRFRPDGKQSRNYRAGQGVPELKFNGTSKIKHNV